MGRYTLQVKGEEEERETIRENERKGLAITKLLELTTNVYGYKSNSVSRKFSVCMVCSIKGLPVIRDNT